MSIKKIENIDISPIINRLYIATGTTSDSDLCKYLGKKSRGAVWTWKNSGKVPKKIIELVAFKTGYKKEWLISGTGEKFINPPIVAETPTAYPATISPYIKQVTTMMASMDEDMQKDICLSVEKEKLLRDLLRQKDSDEKAG